MKRLFASLFVLFALFGSPASAGYVGHRVAYGSLGGYYTYLGDGEYMYPNDYMLAESIPSLGEPFDLFFSSDGDLQAWFLCSALQSCGGGSGWVMLWHSDTHSGGYVYNQNGNLQIHNSSGTVIWSQGEAGNTHYLYAYQLHSPTMAPGCAAYLNWYSNVSQC